MTLNAYKQAQVFYPTISCAVNVIPSLQSTNWTCSRVFRIRAASAKTIITPNLMRHSDWDHKMSTIAYIPLASSTHAPSQLRKTQACRTLSRPWRMVEGPAREDRGAREARMAPNLPVKYRSSKSQRKSDQLWTTSATLSPQGKWTSPIENHNRKEWNTKGPSKRKTTGRAAQVRRKTRWIRSCQPSRFCRYRRMVTSHPPNRAILTKSSPIWRNRLMMSRTASERKDTNKMN